MNKNLFHILMVFSMIFWGASWISTKVLTNYVNEYELVFLRMGICFISMFPLIYFFKLSFKIDLKSFIFKFAPYTFFIYATNSVTFQISSFPFI